MNIAIIGCGAIAKMRHAPAVAADWDATLCAVCDPVKANADALAGTYHTRAVYDIDEVLRDDTVDAVIICTPERFHCANVVAALKAGKHVLCEKPLAMNADEGRQILEAWQASGKTLMVAFSQRLYDAHRIAKKLLDEGAIGKPIAFRTALAHRGVEYATIEAPTPDFYDRKLAGIGDVMLSVGCHRVDLVSYLFGAKIAAVSALTPTIDKKYADGTPIGAADHAMINVEMDNGVVGTIWISWCCYGKPEQASQIYGTEGVMLVGEGPGVVVQKRGGGEECYGVTPDPNAGQRITHHFIQVLHGREPAICDGTDGQNCLLAMEAVKRSDQEGRRVLVSELTE